MKRLIRTVVRLYLVLTGFLFIFSLPVLLGIGEDRVTINLKLFWEYLKGKAQYLLQTDDPSYLHYFHELDIAGSYQYTMSIMVLSLVAIFFLAIAAALFIMVAPAKFRNLLKNGVNLFEAVPDLLVIFLFQFFVITLYKTTGLKFLQLYGLFGVKPYFIPIVTVSFLPFFLLLQFLVNVMSEEQNQPYVLYVKAKGIGRIKTLLVHIIRNVLPMLILQLRTILWVLLSNIYLVEYMFNINGFTMQFQKILFQGGDFATLIACLLMLSAPLLLIEAAWWFISRTIRGREAVSL